MLGGLTLRAASFKDLEGLLSEARGEKLIKGRKWDKEKIVYGAVEHIQSQEARLKSVRQELEQLETILMELRGEKVELRADKVYLKDELEKLREENRRLRSDNLVLREAMSKQVRSPGRLRAARWILVLTTVGSISKHRRGNGAPRCPPSCGHRSPLRSTATRPTKMCRRRFTRSTSPHSRRRRRRRRPWMQQPPRPSMPAPAPSRPSRRQRCCTTSWPMTMMTKPCGTRRTSDRPPLHRATRSLLGCAGTTFIR